MKSSSAIALFDLDGTLADFDFAMEIKLMSLANNIEIPYFQEQDNEPTYMKMRRRLIKKTPGFWRELPKFSLGFQVLEEVNKLNFDIMILSKGPRNNPTAWAEKIEWCHANLPMDEMDIKITLTEDKGLVYGKVLVDDWIPYVERWLEWRPRGLVIMPAHDRNKDFRHPNVVRYDGTNLNEVIERLTFQRNTTE